MSAISSLPRNYPSYAIPTTAYPFFDTPTPFSVSSPPPNPPFLLPSKLFFPILNPLSARLPISQLHFRSTISLRLIRATPFSIFTFVSPRSMYLNRTLSTFVRSFAFRSRGFGFPFLPSRFKFSGGFSTFESSTFILLRVCFFDFHFFRSLQHCQIVLAAASASPVASASASESGSALASASASALASASSVSSRWLVS